MNFRKQKPGTQDPHLIDSHFYTSWSLYVIENTICAVENMVWWT